MDDIEDDRSAEGMALQRKWLVAVVLGLVGYGLNLLAVPLLPNLQLLFGAIPVFVVAVAYGAGPGFLAGAIAGFRTVFLWTHPYGWIVLALEALAVGLLRSRLRPAFAVAAFWLLVGLWAGLASYVYLLNVPPFDASIAILKQVLNGLVNALVAEGLILAHPIRRALRLSFRPRVRQYLGVLAALSAAIPLLALWILGTRQQNDAAVQAAEMESRVASLLFARAMDQSRLPSGDAPDATDLAALQLPGVTLRARRPDGAILRALPDGRLQLQGNGTLEAEKAFRLAGPRGSGTGTFAIPGARRIPFLQNYDRVLISAERLGGSGWLVWAEMPFERILAPLSRRLLAGELVMIAALLLALLLGTLVARQLELPISALMDATRRLAAGKLDARVERNALAGGPAEPLLLGERLNAMAERIEAAERERGALLESERKARLEAELRAREEAALREATEAVTETFTVEAVVQQIAGSALVATNADGAYVERVDGNRRTLVVAGVAGAIHPPLGAELPFDDSYAQTVIESGVPVLIRRVGDADRQLAGGMSQAHPDATGMVLPLMDSGSAIGALLLLRRTEGPFESHEVKRANTFANLAALAFRKVHLLEESEMRRDEVERVMESRARLIRGFSHDVKNPLGAADGYLQLLEDQILGDLSPRQKESVARVRSSIRAALALIEDLVELARAEAGQLEVQTHTVDVRDVAREMVGEYRAQAAATGLAMSYRFPEAVPLIRSDDRRIRQVLGNLLSNAVKYTPDGGRIEVRVGMRKGPLTLGSDDLVAIDVADTGEGIPPDRRDRIFQEFSRLNPSQTKGAGLGLAISRRVARAIGGDLTFVSEPGKGSTFTVWLPRDWQPTKTA